MLLKQPGKLIVQSYTSVQYLPTGIHGHGKLQMHLKVRTPAPCWLLGLSVAVRVILAHFFSAASQTFGICFRQASGLSGHGAEMEHLLPDRAPTLWMGFLLSRGAPEIRWSTRFICPACICCYVIRYGLTGRWVWGDWWSFFLRVKLGLTTRCRPWGPQIPPGGKGWAYPASSDFSLKLQVKRKPHIFRLSVSK